MPFAFGRVTTPSMSNPTPVRFSRTALVRLAAFVMIEAIVTVSGRKSI